MQIKLYRNIKKILKFIYLKGIKIALDCANGAGYKLVKLFKSLGAKVFNTGVSPNGLNINLKSGSTYQVKFVKWQKNKSSIGIALDGDADRIIVCDEKGKIIDGDKFLQCWVKGGKDFEGGVIGTLMSNYGLEIF